MSQYQTFPGSGVCLACTNFCARCISSTQCLTCVPNVHLYENSSCIIVCPTENGYYNTTINSQLMCLKCWSPSCIKCTNGSSNGCLNCGTAFMDPRNPGRCIETCDLSSNYKINLINVLRVTAGVMDAIMELHIQTAKLVDQVL